MRTSGLAICAWHKEFIRPASQLAFGWVFVYRRADKKQKTRLVYIPPKLVKERALSHGICETCAMEMRNRDWFKRCAKSTATA